jgi:hypothetical protein
MDKELLPTSPKETQQTYKLRRQGDSVRREHIPGHSPLCQNLRTTTYWTSLALVVAS